MLTSTIRDISTITALMSKCMASGNGRVSSSTSRPKGTKKSQIDEFLESLRWTRRLNHVALDERHRSHREEEKLQARRAGVFARPARSLRNARLERGARSTSTSTNWTGGHSSRPRRRGGIAEDLLSKPVTDRRPFYEIIHERARPSSAKENSKPLSKRFEREQAIAHALILDADF